MNASSGYTLIDTITSLAQIIPKLCNLPTSPPSLYIDIEGVNLSRNGSISIVQIYVLPLKHSYLIDVHVLGAAAFTTKSAGVASASLKTILESPSIPKCFFDVRRDSDAIYHLYSISLQGIEDLQLMELATRLGRKRYVNGLARCIDSAGLSSAAADAFRRTKEQGIALFSPAGGGSYEVFNERPLKVEILEYCVQDVAYLPVLWGLYKSNISASWRARVLSTSSARIEESKKSDFNPQARNMALSPW